MNAEEFVEAIKFVVREPAISGTLQVLNRPPGRRPNATLVENAAWYASLSKHDRERLASVLAQSVDMAIFGLLCVFDGVRAAENGEAKGRFEIRYVCDNGAVVLNAEQMLHELY
jgi:hypothetical protein